MWLAKLSIKKNFLIVDFASIYSLKVMTEAGFIKADSNNLPKVDGFMIAQINLVHSNVRELSCTNSTFGNIGNYLLLTSRISRRLGAYLK